jgi:hypothetical protein
MKKILGALLIVISSQAVAQSKTISLAAEKVGKEPQAFVPIVGHWVVATDDGKKVIMVDGRTWKRGQPAGGLADKARDLYGASHEEFIDNVQSFAYYPTAVAKEVSNFENGTITVRFKMIGGTLDRAPGIMFNLKPNGDWLSIRYNGTEDNLVLWTFKDGKRAFVKRNTHNVPLELGTWHEIKVVTKGTQIQGYLDGELLIEHTWETPISGRIGLWAKTDTMAEYSDFTYTPEKKP